jgi:U3 small nucleolar RNA-associated protein 14
MAEELTPEEFKSISLASEKLGSAVMVETFKKAGVPLPNHVRIREAIRVAYEQLKSVVEKWG